MVESQPSKLIVRVRFPLPAPITNLFELSKQIDTKIIQKWMIFLLPKNIIQEFWFLVNSWGEYFEKWLFVNSWGGVLRKALHSNFFGNFEMALCQ